MKYRIPVLTALALAVAVGVQAHDLFIKMDSYHLPANSAVTVPILNSTFLVSENSITADRVADASVASGGHRQEVSMDGWHADADTTFLDMRVGEAGTYVLGVSTLARDLGMSGEDFNTYLATDGIPDVLAQRERDGELDQDVWERYSKHVKAVYQVGDQRTSGYDEVFGYPAELVPLNNPYELSVGDEIALRVMVDGKPVQRQLVLAGGVRDGKLFEEREDRSDGEGVVRFTLHESGRWYAKFINMAKTDAEDIDYESKWATISFEVR
jgi:hypothetical protein